ncbi:MAG: hypothetical protein ACRCW2_07495 [Cellulosilyticaceae bacterium]
MNNIILLLKVYFMGRLGVNKVLHTKDAKERQKYTRVLLFSILGVLALLAYWTFYCYLIDENMRMMGINSGLLAITFGAVGIICLATTVYKGTSILFSSEDFNIVMPLPIKMSELVTAKLITLYLSNLVFTLGFMLPAMGIYIWREHPGILFYVYGVIALLVTPIIPMIVATVLGVVISIVSARFKHHNLVSILLMVVVFVAIMCSSFMVGSMDEASLGQIGTVVTEAINKMYPLTPLFIGALCNYQILDLLGLVLISLGCFGIFVGVVGAMFKQIHTLLTTTHTSKNYRMTRLETTTPLVAMYKRELRRFISSPTYVMNTGIGAIMLLILAGVLVYQQEAVQAFVLQVPEVSGMIPILVCLGAALCVMMTDTTAISISLEGKYFEQLKMYPVSVMQIFMSKIMVNLTMTVPVIVIAVPVMGIACGMSLLQILLGYLVVGAYALLGPMFGIMINLLLPKLEWDNEITVIKQSMASLLGVLGGIPLVILAGASLLLVGVIDIHLILIGVALVIGIIDFILYRLLKTWGIRKFYEL